MLRLSTRASRWDFFRFARHLATKAGHDPSRLRNIALVAHIDSGKTTLTESILLSSSYLSHRGSVDTGSTTTDFLPAERERGITIQSASIPVQWKDWMFNLIDTPGHADFGMEVESASRIIDGAVVLIDSVEGVEAQTEGVWKQLDRYGVQSRIMFMNKMDRPGSSFRSSMMSLLSHRLHPSPMALTLPIASFDPRAYSSAEPGIEGLVDLVNWEVWKWDERMALTRHPLPPSEEDIKGLDIFKDSHPIIPHLPKARGELLENLSMFSEPLMETLLELPSGPNAYLGVPPSAILPHLRDATLRNQILPVICGSAMKNVGTQLLMDYIGALLPSPIDIEHEKQRHNAPLQMLAWKVTWDKQKGWMTFVRVYSGTLTPQSVVYNSTRDKKEKVSKLMLLYASEAKEVPELPFGSVGVILGLKYTRTGDTLVSSRGQKSTSALSSILPPPPVMSASVIPHSRSDLEPVQEALESLSRTDPSVRIDMQEGQILVHGLGALHLEIVEGRLRDEWKAQFEFGKRRVSYRETIVAANIISATDTWKADVGQISLSLVIRRLEEGEKGDPVWGGNLVVDTSGQPYTSPEDTADTPESYIARGLFSVLSSSPHTSLEISDTCIQVQEYECPPGVHPTSLTPGSAVILRNILRDAGMGPVMEPFIKVKVVVDDSSLGKVVKDLTECGSEILGLGTGSNSAEEGTTEDLDGYSTDGVYIPPEWLSPSSPGFMPDSSQPRQKRTIHAMAPLSRMLDYSSRLRALSGGHGQFEMLNAGFREVADIRKVEILKEIGRA